MPQSWQGHPVLKVVLEVVLGRADLRAQEIVESSQQRWAVAG